MYRLLANIRKATPDEGAILRNIDIKCFESAWSSEEWLTYLTKTNQYLVLAVTYYGCSVGFAVYDHKMHSILKIGISPAARGRCYSEMLIDALFDDARFRGAQSVNILVPEDWVYPGPVCIAGWLLRMGFRATSPLVSKCFVSCGQPVDGIRFVNDLRKTCTFQEIST
jgi:N-acetylglutamate synthase-like GNAT family acetyltransferase